MGCLPRRPAAEGREQHDRRGPPRAAATPCRTPGKWRRLMELAANVLQRLAGVPPPKRAAGELPHQSKLPDPLRQLRIHEHPRLDECRLVGRTLAADIAADLEIDLVTHHG